MWGAPPRSSMWGWGAPPPPPPPQGSYGSTGTGCGCCCGSLFVVLLIVVVILIVAGDSIRTGIGDLTEGQKQENLANQHSDPADAYDGKEEEQIPREKLSAEACVRTEQMIQDTLDWISDTETVKQAMEEFYEMTGVQPYLYICDNLNGKGEEITDEEVQNYLRGMYETLYDDEGHMIFVFMEYAVSEYITFLYTGEDANYVLDEDAREIFLTNADRYYTDSSLSDEEYFAKIFRESANQIMK